MIKTREVIKVIKTVTSVPVYDGYVPDGFNDVAIAIECVSDDKGRVISGIATGKSGLWRATISGNNIDDVEDTLSDLTKLDCRAFPSFQKVFANNAIIEPRSPDDDYRRAFIDLTLYR